MFSELRQMYRESNGMALLAHSILVNIGGVSLYGINEVIRDSSWRGALPDIIDYANHCGNIDPSILVTTWPTALAGTAAHIMVRSKPSRKAAVITAGIGAAFGIGLNVAVEVEPFAHVVAPEFNSGRFSGGDPIDLGYGTVTSLVTSVLLARVLARKPEGYADPLYVEASAAEATAIPDIRGEVIRSEIVPPDVPHPSID